MLKLNSELRAQAREALRGKWPMAAVAALIYSVIAGGLSAIPVGSSSNLVVNSLSLYFQVNNYPFLLTFIRKYRH